MRNSEPILRRWPYLERAWTRRRLAQALLLVGDGEYAQEATRALIRQCLCEGAGGVDCSCRSCRAAEGTHPDLISLQPDPKTIRLDAVQRAVARTGSAPLWSPAVVVWVGQVTAMTLEAENPLLKSLEEPWEHVQYVLNVDRLDGVLPTVRSRCQAISVEDPEPLTSAFRPEWLVDRDRDLANDLVAAGMKIRERYARTPDPRLLSLFSTVWQAREGLDHNHNLDLTRERVRMAWEAVYGQLR